MRLASLGFCLPLALFGTTSCLVAGLEVGPGQEAGSAGASGASSGSPFVSPGGSGGSNSGGALGVGAGAGTAGEGGAGGKVVVRCEDHPISDKLRWSVTASSSSLGNGVETDPLYNPPSHVADGALNERWASGQPQEDGQWFHVDFGVEVALSHVILQQGRDIDDFPRGYEISLSDRHTDFDAVARASGRGASVSEKVIPLDRPALGRYLLIKQTGSAKSWWSIAEISVECH